MAWNFFAIVDATDDDPALYPILSGPDSNCAVQIEASDGQIPVRLWANAARVLGTNPAGQLTSVFPLPSDVTWSVLVTDVRVIVYCEKYDKGGGWAGFGGAGLAVALAANAISKARAAHRRKGRVLVAHVRYPWLERVLATPKVSWLTSERVRLRVNAMPGGTSSRHIMIELELPKHESALSLANEITHRAARYRLAHDPTMQPDQRQRFTDLASAVRRIPSTPSSTQQPTWAEYIMPTNYRVNALTAFPKTQEPAGRSPSSVSSAEPPPDPGGTRRCVWMKCSLRNQPTAATQCPECGIPTEPLGG